MPEEGRDRSIPPAVSDSSHAPNGSGIGAVRPWVDVELQVEQGTGLQDAGATDLVQREAQRCYRLALQTNHSLEGTVIYEAIITSNGRVAGVEKISTTAPSEGFERCVERTMYALRFENSSGATALVRRLYLRVQLSRETFDSQALPIKRQSLKN